MDLLTTLNVIALVACALLFAMSMYLHRRVSTLESQAGEKGPSKEGQKYYSLPATKGGVLQMLIARARDEPSSERRERLYLEILDRVREIDDDDEEKAVRGKAKGSWAWVDPDPIKEEE